VVPVLVRHHDGFQLSRVDVELVYPFFNLKPAKAAIDQNKRFIERDKSRVTRAPATKGCESKRQFIAA